MNVIQKGKDKYLIFIVLSPHPHFFVVLASVVLLSAGFLMGRAEMVLLIPGPGRFSRSGFEKYSPSGLAQIG